MITKRMLKYIPENIKDRLDPDYKLLLLNGHEIIKRLKGKNVTILGCNIYLKQTIPAIMKTALKLNSVVCYQLSLQEIQWAKQYMNATPLQLFNTFYNEARKINYDIPFYLNVDDIICKSSCDLEEREKLIEDFLNCGFTSFALNCASLPEDENVRFSSQLSKKILEYNYGLEVAVESSLSQDFKLTSPEKCRNYLKKLSANNVIPDLLEINNGLKRGNYGEGERIFMDLELTSEISKNIRPTGIVQHGVTGTPQNYLKEFSMSGIKKANVGTVWKNIALATFPKSLTNKLETWSMENNRSLKEALFRFNEEISNLDRENLEQFEAMVSEVVNSFIKSFSAENTVSILEKEV